MAETGSCKLPREGMQPTSAAERLCAERAAFVAELRGDGLGEEGAQELWEAKVEAGVGARDERRAAIKRAQRELRESRRAWFKKDPSSVVHGCDTLDAAAAKRSLKRERAAAEAMEAHGRRVARLVSAASAV